MRAPSLCSLLALCALTACSQRAPSGQPSATASIAANDSPPPFELPPSASVPKPPTPEEISRTGVAPLKVLDTPGYLEITNTDITTHPDFDATRGTYFGVRLGMTFEEVERTIKTMPSLRLEVDTDAEEDGQGRRANLYETADARGSLAELVWDKGPGLEQVRLLAAAEPHLKGKTARLLSTSAVSETSELTSFLGKPGAKKSEGDKEVSTDLYPYPARHMLIEDAHLRRMRRITVIFTR